MVHESSRHGNAGQIRCPYLVHLINLQIPEQVGVNLVVFHWLAGIWLWPNSLYTHELVKPLDALAIYFISPAIKLLCHFSTTIKGVLQVEPVNLFHKPKVILISFCGLIIEHRSGQANKLALPADTQNRMINLDHSSFLLHWLC